MTADERAEKLARVAMELAERVREYPADDNQRWLVAMLPDEWDREQLLYVLAAAVPIDVPWRQLTAGTDPAFRAALLREQFAGPMPKDLPRRQAAS